MSKELDNLVFLNSKEPYKDFCPYAVHDGGRSVYHHQCNRKGKKEYAYTYEGKKYQFCKSHFPANIQKRNEERHAKWEKEYKDSSDAYAKKMAMNKLGVLSIELLPYLEWPHGNCGICGKGILGGHKKGCKMSKALKLVEKLK